MFVSARKSIDNPVVNELSELTGFKVELGDIDSLDYDMLRELDYDCIIFEHHPGHHHVIELASLIRESFDIPTIICTDGNIKNALTRVQGVHVDAITPLSNLNVNLLADRALHAIRENREHSMRVLELEILRVLNWRSNLDNTLERIIKIIRDHTSIEAVGVRLSDGGDYPYYGFDGFRDDHILRENSLCTRNIESQIVLGSDGKPVLECMCGNVIRGRFDSEKPYFTEGGSFWTNSTSDLLDNTTEMDRMGKTRNVCNIEGYESVALIPIRYEGETLGLIQLNHSDRDKFTEGYIQRMEDVAESIGIVVGGATEYLRQEATMREHIAIFESVQDPVVIMDVDDFTIVNANKATQMWAVEHGANLTSDTCHGLFAGRKIPCEVYGEACPILRMMEDGKSISTIIARRDNKGNKVYLEESANPITNEGQITGAVLMVREISERKLVEQNLVRFL